MQIYNSFSIFAAMLNWRFAKDYIIYRLNAKSRHGLHSPYIYQLVDEVIYDFKPYAAYEQIESKRSELLKSNQQISVTDLGAGSQLNAQRTKSVSAIAKNALKSPALAQLLFRLAKSRQPRHIIELGTCLGITTAYLAKAIPGGQIITIEGCPQTAAIAKENFNDLKLDQIEILVGNFDDLLNPLLNRFDTVDFVYVDGNHRKEATLNYFYQLLPKVSEHTLLIFDDIYWSEGMKEAWTEIKNHPGVSSTVDLFWIGLVFFRTGQAKENFTIRF
jgi:predicted O-methyltransferase YrrM